MKARCGNQYIYIIWDLFIWIYGIKLGHYRNLFSLNSSTLNHSRYIMDFGSSKMGYFYCIIFFALVCFGESSVSLEEDSEIPNMHQARLPHDDGITRDQVVLTKGESLKLECEFYPSAGSWSYIQWIKLHEDGQQFKHSIIPANHTFNNGSAVISSIVLESVTGSDTANYSCILTTALVTSSMEFFVAVKDKEFCTEGLCKPHGRCIELLQGYKCECDDEYTGEECGILDTCFDRPCLNNGSCMITDYGFNCSCSEGFKGNKCERQVCMASSCNGGGSCRETSDGKIKCDCRYNRAGKYCEHACSFSNSKFRYRNYYCSRSKTCVIGANDGVERCKCEERGSGTHCIMSSDVTNECLEPNICSGRGSCYDLTYKYSCSCQSYASGTNCEFFNECGTSNLCRRYGGTCVDLVQGYKCTRCPSGQTGDKCQYMKNPCKVTCGQSSMEVRCDMKFLNSKLQNIPIYLNSRTGNCEFKLSRYGYSTNVITKSIQYNHCGTKISLDGDTIIYSNSLQAGIFGNEEEKNDVITRLAGNFQFDMECRIPIVYNDTSAMIKDYSLERNESIHLHDERNVTLSTLVSFKNRDWNSITKYNVGDRLYVELVLQTSNQIMSQNGVLKPTTCYASPDSQGIEPRYVLLENGCIRDKTFRYEQRNSRRSENNRFAYFSFDSFSFKGERGKLYLHCNARLCINPTSGGEDFSFDECMNICSEQKEGVGKETVTTASSIATSPTTDAEQKLNNYDGVLERMKRFILGTDDDRELIERYTRNTVYISDV
ncbi:uncharacterized protein LOC120343009 [Styela clava]